jgi:hypothetical protein
MHRRNALQWLVGFGTAIRAWSQNIQFPGDQAPALKTLAAHVLPSTCNPDRIAEAFVRYVREYRPGADTEHGYGFTRVLPKPPSPALEYIRQLAALPVPLTADAIAAALDQAQIKDLPRLPEGKSVIADLMGFYFRSAEANDLCYRAAIKRDTCRGLDGSSKKPAPLTERS